MYQIPDAEMVAAYHAGKITKTDLAKFGLRRIVCEGDFTDIDAACRIIFNSAPETWEGVLHRLPAMIVNGSPALDAWRDVPGFMDWCRENPGWPDRIRLAAQGEMFPEVMQVMADEIRAYCKARRRPH